MFTNSDSHAKNHIGSNVILVNYEINPPFIYAFSSDMERRGIGCEVSCGTAEYMHNLVSYSCFLKI
jgi:hypothetical protein